MYAVTLTVEDGNGQEGKSTKNIEIKALGPTAQFEFQDDNGNVVEKVRSNANITLDGSDTIVPDGDIKEYKWNFGDGIERTTNESNTDYSWSTGGYYNVTLMVVDENDKTGEITKILQVVPEDYSDEGSDGTLVAQDNGENYNIDVEIFVSTVQVEFTDINCVGIGGQIDYTITVLDSEENEIGQNGGNVACGGEGANWNIEFYNDDNALNLGNYQITIAFTNSGTPVQANWNYSFAIVYDF
jgi:PKD repeat protein